MLRRLAQSAIGVVAAMLLTSAVAQAQINQEPDIPVPGTSICPGGNTGSLIWAANRVPHPIAWTMSNGRWRPCL